ncbi:AMP-dependent synthetase/ligase [Sediminispirochaeta bajacaliforniensis]|uniref:AMP-dependent synthetase/ligase n=1 Tax=Sediminispirochaeta bajacaliforniensis TaxID=148 RepID=UPI0003796EA8|nr:AMP-binding protein [Sediminispirochaeta bajacaliforniensis]
MAPLDTVPKRIRETARKHPDMTALLAKGKEGEFEAASFREMMDLCAAFSCALNDIGVERGAHVGIISDNRREWIIADLAMLGLGVVDVPRGSDSTADEIAYILGHAECEIAFAENGAQADKIIANAHDLPLLKRIILFDAGRSPSKKLPTSLELSSFDEMMKRGSELLPQKQDFFDKEIDKGSLNDLATIIYTSGTTGEPKGVMLPHRSFIFQLDRVYDHIPIVPGQILLSVLPVWHSFERAVEYIMLARGAAIAYSKPIGAVMLPDMQKVKPQWLASVPRIWEGVRAAIFKNIAKEGKAKQLLFSFFVAVGELHSAMFNMVTDRKPDFVGRHRWLDILLAIIPLILLTPLQLLGSLLVFGKLKARLGGKFIAGISGGGALPPYVDRFFQAAGILLLEGYGLTETGPVLAVRKQKHPVHGTVGPLLADIEHRVVNREGVVLPPGRKGVLYVKSPQVMDGYYKREEATEAVLHDGWLNTGDITLFTRQGEFKILGRAKETIVLLGGENIEPVPIEEHLCASDAIAQAMVVGQDKKFLAALIVPEMEKLQHYAQEKGISYIQAEELLTNPEIQEYVHDRIQEQVNPKNGFKHFERIYRFTLLPKPFEVGKELTHTLKIRRSVVYKLYRHEIDSLFR